MSRATPGTPPWHVVLVLAGVAAVVVFALHNQEGMLRGNDSAFYVSVADNLRAGRGLTTPVGFDYHAMSPLQFVAQGDTLPLQGAPPLFSMLLAVGGALGLSATATTAVLNLVAAVAITVLAALMTWIMARRSLLAVGLVVGFTLVQPTLLALEQAVLPEALFAALLLAQVVLVWRYLQTRSVRTLVGLALLTAAAVLLRQIGLALVGSGVLAILALRPGPLAVRARHAGLFAGLALLPLVVYWPLSSRGAVGGGGFTQMAAHLPAGDDYQELVDTVRHWVTDLQAPTWFTLVVWAGVLVVVAAAVAGWRRTGSAEPGDRAARSLASVILLTMASYVGVLWLTSAFLDADVTFTSRYLATLQPLLFSLGAAGLARYLAGRPAEQARPLAGALVGAALLVLGVRAWATVDRGVGIPLVDAATSVGPIIEDLPDDTVIFAELPEYLYNGVGRAAYPLPTRRSRYTDEPNDDLEEQLAELVALARDRPVVVVYTRFGARDYMVPFEELAAAVPLTEIGRGPTEIVYRVVP